MKNKYINNQSTYFWSLLLALVLMATSHSVCKAQTYATNLVTDGNAAKGNGNTTGITPTDWNTSSGTSFLEGEFGFTSPDGGGVFDFYTGSTNPEWISQIIDVSSLSTDISTGTVKMVLSAYMLKGHLASTICRMILEQLDGSNSVVATSQVDNDVLSTVPSGGTWAQKTITIDGLNISTRKLRIKLYGELIGADGQSFVEFDGISLQLYKPATITTQAVSSIAITTATGNGNISSFGGDNATAHGVCWNITGTPTTADSKANNGAASSTGAFTASMIGLTANTTYKLRAYATNTAGTSYGTEVTFTTLATVPSSPTVNTPTASSLNVTVNQNGNPASTQFCIQETSTGKYVQTDGTLGASSVWQNATTWGTKTVTGLTAATTYTFHVKARNSGLTETAYGATAFGITSATIPGAPTGVSATRGNAQASVAFTAPASNGGSAITGYTVTSNPGGLTGTGTSSPIVVTGLTNGTSYTFTVTATNGVGTSLASSASSAVTPATVPGSPTAVSATSSNGQATVTFTAPASNGGSAITGYTVTSSPGSFTGTGTGSPITVTGLTNGTAYTFTVTVTNIAGTSVASASSSSITPKADQTISFANPGSKDFGTSPTLNARATSGLVVTFSTATPDVCSITPGGILTFKKAGTCTILADQIGNGTYSAAPTVSQTFTVNAVTPGTPVIGTVTPGNGLANVSFAAPSSNGGADVTYTVTSSPGNFTESGTISPITVTGLANGTAYTFTVTATNTAGTSVASTASNSVTPNMAQTITFDNPGTQDFGTSPALSATATSGLAVTFSTTTPDVCSITPGGILTFKKAGTCTILADQIGNGTYSAAPTVSQTFTVNAVTPGTPVIGTATPGDGVASVSFIAPLSNGGADVTYTITSSPGNFTGSGTTSPITVTGLANGTSYTFTITAANIAGTSIASAASNSVIAYSAPIVTTDAASDITSSGAMLKGTVSANGASTTVTFEYGITVAYGTSITAIQSPVIEIAGIAVSKMLTGLISNTTYHYRVVGVNTGGTTNGSDQTFTTDLNTGLDNAAATVFSLYPNPTSEGFYIYAGDVTTFLSICDLSGRTVLTQQVTGNSYVNINPLKNGVYVVKVNGMVAKLVKK